MVYVILNMMKHIRKNKIDFPMTPTSKKKMTEHSEHTINSLKELQEQLANNNSESVVDETEIASNSGDSQSNKLKSVNFLIQNMFDEKGKKKQNRDILSTIIAQRELDRQKIEQLMLKKYESDIESGKIEMQLHYTKLDKNNLDVKCDELTKKLKISKDEFKQLSKKYERYNVYYILLIFVMFFCNIVQLVIIV